MKCLCVSFGPNLVVKQFWYFIFCVYAFENEVPLCENKVRLVSISGYSNIQLW